MKNLYHPFNHTSLIKLNLKFILLFILFSVVTSTAIGQNCTINAGILNQTVCEGTLVTLSGNDPT